MGYADTQPRRAELKDVSSRMRASAVGIGQRSLRFVHGIAQRDLQCATDWVCSRDVLCHVEGRGSIVAAMRSSRRADWNQRAARGWPGAAGE